MEKQTVRGTTRLTADQRIYKLGYDRGYTDGQEDGIEEGEEAFQGWLIAELRDLCMDVRLGLRHDASTPLDVLAAVMALVQGGKPISMEDDD